MAPAKKLHEQHNLVYLQNLNVARLFFRVPRDTGIYGQLRSEIDPSKHQISKIYSLIVLIFLSIALQILYANFLMMTCVS